MKPAKTHSPRQCAGRHCCIHNPSAHHMRDWPLNWREDRGLMERTCPHGIGHPDPDDLAYKATYMTPERVARESIHGCDGCCSGVNAQTEREGGR